MEESGFSSIQDRGRFGLQRCGISPAGAMDLSSLEIGNMLVGNLPGAPAVETGLSNMAFRVDGAAIRLAVTGASRRVLVDRQPLKMNTSAVVAPGVTVSLGGAQTGVFSYVCVDGGILGEPQYGSYSVDERASFGCPVNRPLRPGDIIPVRGARPRPSERAWRSSTPSGGPIRVIMGPQNHRFFEGTIRQFLSETWRVSNEINRMCYRLEGSALAHARGYDIVSDATVKGAIQIAGNGQPFVLMADRGTVGGYPKIAVIASVDLDRFAQLAPGARLRFQAIEVDEAHALIRRRVMEQRQAHRWIDAGMQNAAVNLDALSSGIASGACTSEASHWHEFA